MTTAVLRFPLQSAPVIGDTVPMASGPGRGLCKLQRPPGSRPAASWRRFQKRGEPGRWLLVVPEDVAAGERVMVENRHGTGEPRIAGPDVGGVFVTRFGPHAGERVRLVEPVEPGESEAARKDAACNDPDCPDELLPRRRRRSRGESQR